MPLVALKAVTFASYARVADIISTISLMLQMLCVIFNTCYLVQFWNLD